MGTITAEAVIDAATFTLQDPGNVQWSRPELLGYLNDGQRDLCVVKPDACTRNQAVQLAAGTKQALPADGKEFIRVVRNMGAAGTTPGRVPRQIPLATMDQLNPSWHSAAANATVQEVAYDERDPKVFYVSPPQPASARGYADIMYYGVPADLSGEDSAIVLDDIYKTALVNYVIYRAYLKEGEFSNPAGATAHRSEFLALLGAKTKAEQAGVA